MPARMGIMDKDGPVPLYYQLLNELRGRVVREFNPGDLFPTEENLCSQYGVSRTTVRAAIDVLARENVLKRVRGKGTYVQDQKIEQNFFQNLTSFSHEMKIKGMVPSTKVIDFDSGLATEEDVFALNIPMDSSVFRLKRLRFINDQPVVLVVTHVPYALCTSLDTYNFESESLYEVLEQNFNLSVVKARREVEATHASKELAVSLQVKRGAPLLLVKTTAYTRDQTAIEYSVAFYRGDRNRFVVELER